MSRRIHRLYLPLLFPAGVAPGEGSDYNLLTLARNGMGTPLLRGTALAGVLRHAWTKHLRRAGHANVQAEVADFFGRALGDDADACGIESRLQVSDCVLEFAQAETLVRTHHLRNRHTGSVADGGLFSLEACPPGTRTAATLWLRDEEEDPAHAFRFLKLLIGLLQGGLTLGGKSSRGLGFVQLAGDAVYRVYDLTNVEVYAAWLDEHRDWRANPTRIPAGTSIEAAPGATTSTLQVGFCLGIPRGQDLLVGDGQGLEHEIEPQRIQAADGQHYWRLPGSSLRGLFRSWITRLAARDGHPVADQVERQRRVWRGELYAPTDPFNGDNLGWCFLPKDQRRHNKASTDCPVASLFGTLFGAGRIYISDAYAKCQAHPAGQPRPEEQLRKHVAVDRITGGAAESMLFENTVLTAYPDGASPRFDVTVRVEDAREEDACWLAKTLRALDLGLLRLGSSKSSGRLKLMESPRANGPYKEQFSSLYRP